MYKNTARPTVRHEHWLPEAPGRVIVVDSVRTATARQADLHLQPFPGSDAALAFSIAHVFRRDGLLDRRLLAGHAIGWEELEPQLERCTPGWGERITGVPAAAIEQAARWYGTGPSLLWIGQGFQRQPRGGNAVRAVAQIAALSGNLGRPGTGFLYLNGAGNRMLDEDYIAGAHLAGPPPEPISHMDLAGCLEDPRRSRALLCWNINIAASNPDQARLRRALTRTDLFTVAIDLFATDTTDLADVVLPAASFLESDDLVASYFHLSLSAQVKVIEPLGQSLTARWHAARPDSWNSPWRSHPTCPAASRSRPKAAGPSLRHPARTSTPSTQGPPATWEPAPPCTDSRSP